MSTPKSLLILRQKFYKLLEWKIYIDKKLKYHWYKAVDKSINKAGTLFIVDYYAMT